jgi:hypothetical protein
MNVYFNEKYFIDDVLDKNKKSLIKLPESSLFSISVSDEGMVRFVNCSTQTESIEMIDQTAQTESTTIIDQTAQTESTIIIDQTVQTEEIKETSSLINNDIIGKNDIQTQTEPLYNINNVNLGINNFPFIYLPSTGIVMDDPINFYKKENAKLKQHVTNISKNFNELVQLVSHLIKIDSANPEIETIKRNLTIIVNRELRLKYAFPFFNIKY